MPDSAALEYALALKRLKTEWYYVTPRHSAEAELLAQVATAREKLKWLAPGTIESMPDRLSFWINVYNGAVIDQAIEAGVCTSVKEVRGFFRRRRILIAGQALSLDDVEHGMLRCNRRHPARLLPPLLWRPHLRGWMVESFDPRIHFALNCGANSCPPIAVYTPADVQTQLDLAARAFINGEIEVDEERRVIHANRILLWYRRDFPSIEACIRGYRDTGLAAGRWSYRWKPYDWSL